MSKPKIKILLAAPRGFCAGVDRAIQIVKLALKRYGKPIYVRHEIVHNRYVVEGLERGGAIFVDELNEEDQVFEHSGVKVIIDPKSLVYLDGTELDYVKEGLNEGFEFNNPNAKGECGCGESFNV